LAERLVHEVWAAGRQVRAKHRAQAEAEFLDEQGEADSDLFAGRPGDDMDRGAREPGDRVSFRPAPSCRREGKRRTTGPARRRDRIPKLSES
jgi:hypothetical protein